MNETMQMRPIAHIRTDFPTKFGIPRQSGLVPELRATIVFTPEYRDEAALRGIEGYSHLWLIWQFSEVKQSKWSPTVRPPRLGGNLRMGVFATRSPYRPNPLGLSSVKFEGVQHTENDGCVLLVSGADLLDGTPIYDIKPYIPYVDSHPDAKEGFTSATKTYALIVSVPEEWLTRVPEEHRAALRGVLASDPRPSYQDDAGRVYGMAFAGLEVKFTVSDGVLTVCGVEPCPNTTI